MEICCEGEHSVNIPAKFGSKWQNGFNEENNSSQRGRTPSDGNIFTEVGLALLWSMLLFNLW
jgi:hypothetical protein